MEEKFVQLCETAMTEAVILNAAKQGNVTLDQINQRVRSIGLPLEHVDVQECIDHLVETEHLTKEGNNLKLTNDGQQDINKVGPWFAKVAQTVGTAGTVGGAGTGTSGAGRPR